MVIEERTGSLHHDVCFKLRECIFNNAMKILVTIVPLEWLGVSHVPFVPKESSTILRDICVGVVELALA